MNIINVSWPKDYSDVIKDNLIPGKPLAVIGHYGLAKTTCTIKAIEKLNLKTYLQCYYMSWPPNLAYTTLGEENEIAAINRDYIKKLNSLPGDTVIILDEINKIAESSLSDMVNNQLSNPDRIVVITGVTAPSHILERCATIINVKAPWDK